MLMKINKLLGHSKNSDLSYLCALLEYNAKILHLADKRHSIQNFITLNKKPFVL